MRHSSSMAALMCGSICLCLTAVARADTLLSFSGSVALADGVAPDGVKVKLQVDLDRNGKLDSFETLSGSVSKDGSYALEYALDPQDFKTDLKLLSFVSQLVAAYEARGFDALLDGGPLPVVLSFEREGYGTVVKRLDTLFDSPNVDATLAPLGDVQCAGDGCLSPDGGVRLSDFPGGTKIARAYADAYDPSQETARFPGLFSDHENNLLVSSGFAEVNLYQEDGTPVHQVSAPVSARFEAKRPSWSTLPDLQPNTGRIEVPMYSFDQASGEWVAEADGELQLADGQVVSEDNLDAIHDGSFDQSVFVAFETKHFSTFNCDAPISVRACVKGRLVGKASGKALAGIAVSLEGVSYTGSAGTLITGADGTFASDVRKSELASEDLDHNGKLGEPLTAHVVATGTGVFVADAFQTPTAQGTVGQASHPSCKPADCDCFDLGDIEVELEEPRLCRVSLQALFSGVDVVGSGGPLAPGDAVVGASVRGSLVGSVQLPQAAVAAACDGEDCGPVDVPDDGNVTFSVPVVGDEPEIQLDASLSVQADGTLHYYSASQVITGCARDESTAPDPGPLELDHSEVTGLGSFIAALGDAVPAPSGGSVDSSPTRKKPFGAGGCACRQAGGRSGSSAPLVLGLLLGAALGRRRRQRSTRVGQSRKEGSRSSEKA